jgi:hypothetical protein
MRSVRGGAGTLEGSKRISTFIGRSVDTKGGRMEGKSRVGKWRQRLSSGRRFGTRRVLAI